MWCSTLTKTHGLLFFICTVVGIDSLASTTTDCDCPSVPQNARCSKQTDCKVICDDGYWGNNCQFGRIRLTSPRGYITDGDKSYPKLSKRMWLIDPGYRPNASIHFQIEEFSTECNWDHLYIFDGDSTSSPLLASFNGHLLGDVNSTNVGQIPQEIVAKSGRAYIYFYSDLAAVQSGFNISYSIVSNCTCVNGRCNTAGLCVCNIGWTGSHCNVRKNCSTSCKNGVCNETLGSCICYDSFTGADCSQPVTSSYWTRLNIDNTDDEISPRASHAATVIGNDMWVYNGFKFSNTNKKNNLYRYNLKNKTWRSLPSEELYFTWGHSMISYQSKLIIFGGERDDHTILNRLLVFDTNSSKWSDLRSSSVAVTGHTATLVEDKMIVIFGLTTDGLFPGVQEYDFGKSKWQVIENKSAFNTARYGHTSVYDPFSERIYVYGGTARTISPTTYPLSSLMAYYPHSRKWITLTSSTIPRTLHSAVIIDHMMIVFGGNPYTGHKQKNITCHTTKLQVYDLVCQRWHLESLPKVAKTLARYGHTAVTKERTMYIFGGFNGALFNDILTYTHGECNRIMTENECLKRYFSAGCYWNNSQCVNKENLKSLPQCPDKYRKLCREIESCDECSMTPSCGWADESCQVKASNTCPMRTEDICPLYFNCNSCKKAGCFWSSSNNWCQRQNTSYDCSVSCSDLTTHAKCVSKQSCLWCENLQRCIDTKLYIVHYPYGQCFEWINNADRGVTCKGQSNCQDCLTLPSCGWNEGSVRNGAGECLKGGATAPKNVLNWHFFDCPLCQCNGHSNCPDNSSVCINCRDRTTGEKCDRCAPGYFGDPINGGKCEPCSCNGHADTCDRRTGICKCNMKGVEGDHCDRCTASHYVGNASNGGFCYYQLAPDYLYKINVSDRTRFNFICLPNESDKNTIVTVNIFKGNPLHPALLNISVGSDSMRETYLLTNVALSSQYEEKFSKDSFSFGSDHFHFKIYVYNITPFSLVSVSVHQPHDGGINLLKFFIIFLGCFVGLLLCAVIFWKAKIFCDSFRRTRRRNVELVYMTNRPFASVPIFVEKPGHVPRKAKPSPLTSEICYGNKAAVVTVLVRLPLCAQAENTAGTAALCLGSTLVSCNEPQGSKMVNYMKSIKRRRNPFRSSPS